MSETSPRGVARIGLVGLGGHGRIMQDACAQAPNLKVTSVFDPVAREAEEAAERFGCHAALSYEALIRENDVDAVVLVTPNHLHRGQTESALEVGKHIFVEKPIAPTVADGLSMVERAEAKGLVMMIGHHMRFLRSSRKALQYIEDGRLGEIVSVEIHFSSDRAFHLEPDVWRLHPELCPLLPVMQLGVHAFDLVHYLVGRIVEVNTQARAVTTPEGVVDNVVAFFSMEHGILGTMVSNYCSPTLFEYRISGTEGALQCTPESFVYTPRTGDGRVVDDLAGLEFEGYVEELIAFGESVLRPAAPAIDGWIGLQALAVVEAMQLSYLTRQPHAVQLFESEHFTTFREP